MFVNVTVQFFKVNFCTVRLFLKDGETVRDALRSRQDAAIIDGYMTEGGEFVAI